MIKEDAIRVFQELFLFGNFEKILKATLIALIPKTIRASDVKDYYRPITRVNEVV